MSKCPAGILKFARKLRELKALKDWKVTTNRSSGTVNLRYPKKERKVGPRFARAIRAFLRNQRLIPDGVRLSIQMK